METKKMSLANIQGKLNRAEMKNIMAGSGWCPNKSCAGGFLCMPDATANNACRCNGSKC